MFQNLFFFISVLSAALNSLGLMAMLTRTTSSSEIERGGREILGQTELALRTCLSPCVWPEMTGVDNGEAACAWGGEGGKWTVTDDSLFSSKVPDTVVNKVPKSPSHCHSEREQFQVQAQKVAKLQGTQGILIKKC